ncbi:MarR family winged helix-turn-helix transcriptional regulator [Glaciihabitans sp. dw_435]|uniref:MarR family winged helix-turn-helix transcriptional regulator n=1 Tax=Glaciihabitans sp. dw_435 TaxID=2720081 RepID=UPI001BD420A0|nr:MarR family transcriptional regulator [Glaciihabitans sp. dw_435]
MTTPADATDSFEADAPGQGDELVDLLVQTSFDVIAIVTRVGAEHDMSLTLVRMLGILRDRTLKAAELADYLGLERSTVSGLIDRAERRGFVVREAHSADGRSVQLRLTDAGQAMAKRGADEIAVRMAPLLERVPPRLRELLAD